MLAWWCASAMPHTYIKKEGELGLIFVVAWIRIQCVYLFILLHMQHWKTKLIHFHFQLLLSLEASLTRNVLTINKLNEVHHFAQQSVDCLLWLFYIKERKCVALSNMQMQIKHCVSSWLCPFVSTQELLLQKDLHKYKFPSFHPSSCTLDVMISATQHHHVYIRGCFNLKLKRIIKKKQTPFPRKRFKCWNFNCRKQVEKITFSFLNGSIEGFSQELHSSFWYIILADIVYKCNKLLQNHLGSIQIYLHCVMGKSYLFYLL